MARSNLLLVLLLAGMLVTLAGLWLIRALHFTPAPNSKHINHMVATLQALLEVVPYGAKSSNPAAHPVLRVPLSVAAAALGVLLLARTWRRSRRGRGPA